MVEILIRGDRAEDAATAMADATREIFGTEPGRSRRQAEHTKDAVALWALVVTVPPAVTAMIDLAGRLKLAERIGRLIHHAEATAKTTGAAILIDPGDGKPIPLDQANRETIIAALAEIEAKLKAGRDAQR
jgi:hypothetical protein